MDEALRDGEMSIQKVLVAKRTNSDVLMERRDISLNEVRYGNYLEYLRRLSEIFVLYLDNFHLRTNAQKLNLNKN